jgi:ketosteroid isomerase-like protein
MSVPLVVVLMMALPMYGESSATSAELTALLKQFLAGASRNDPAMHDRFWAEDLIYTGSGGRRLGKAEIMGDVRSATAARADSPTTTYGAEDIRIQEYGDTAVVAFRLVRRTEKDGKAAVTNYLNTGTFLKRGGRWQAVSWQATRMARPDEEARKDVAAVEAAFHHAMLAADVKTLESLLDEGFIWTRRTGERTTRRELLDDLSSGRLRYSKLETKDVTVSAYGDTAVVRGTSPRQRSSFPGSPSGDVSPFTAFYTLTFVDKGEGWKAVAMHSSRP